MQRGISAAARTVCATLAALAVGALAPAGGAVASTRSTTTTTTTTTSAGPGGLPSAFAWFRPGPAPARFRQYTAVQGTAVVSDPPRLKPLGGSGGALSFAARGPRGAYYAFLNVTPEHGTENVAGWAAFRLAALRHGGAISVREEAEAADLAFQGGTGSCVIDDYVTRVGGTAFHEIACFVAGPHTGSVLVVAAPPKSWRSYAEPLERVVSAYVVR